MISQQTTWIGVDRETTNLRVFAVDFAGKLLAENDSDERMACLDVTEFESALLGLIGPCPDCLTLEHPHCCPNQRPDRKGQYHHYRDLNVFDIRNAKAPA